MATLNPFSVLFMICTAIPAFKAEDESSILLRYHASGSAIDDDRFVQWDHEFENPNSFTSEELRTKIASQLLEIANKVHLVVNVVNLTIVFWNNSNFVGADYSYNFRTRDWRDTDKWDKRFSKAYNESDKPYLREQSRLIHPVYLSYGSDNILVPGGEDTPYKTSSELTYELVLDDADFWFEGLLDTNNEIRLLQLWRILDDLFDVYGLGEALRNVTHKFLFWRIKGEVRVSVTLLVLYDLESKFNELNDQERFKMEFVKQYQYLREKLKFEQKLTKVMAIHTTPVQFPKPAISSTTVILTPESTTSTNPPEQETTTSDPCPPSKSGCCSEGLD